MTNELLRKISDLKDEIDNLETLLKGIKSGRFFFWICETDLGGIKKLPLHEQPRKGSLYEGGCYVPKFLFKAAGKCVEPLVKELEMKIEEKEKEFADL